MFFDSTNTYGASALCLLGIQGWMKYNSTSRSVHQKSAPHEPICQRDSWSFALRNSQSIRKHRYVSSHEMSALISGVHKAIVQSSVKKMILLWGLGIDSKRKCDLIWAFEEEEDLIFIVSFSSSSWLQARWQKGYFFKGQFELKTLLQTKHNGGLPFTYVLSPCAYKSS